jgi:hypothetical protein
MSTTATTKKRPASVATTRKMITRTRSAVLSGFAMGLSEDPVLIIMSAYLKTSTSEAAGVPQPLAGPRQAGAKTTLPTIGTGHAAIKKS